MKNFYFRTAVFAIVAAITSMNALAQKVDPADVIAKHRATVGTPEQLSAVKNQMILSHAQFTFKGAASVITGRAVILSATGKSLWGMNFASNEYPQDRFGFDGKNVRVAKATPNVWLLIGEFLFDNREILREGLLGGTLSANWPLLQTELKNAKIKHEGVKAISGKEAIVLSYSIKSGSDLSIKIYLQAGTYQHIRTEYTLIRHASQGTTVDNSAGQSGTIYRLVEEFSNFSKMGELMLPGTYKITYARSGTAAIGTNQTTNRDAEWTFTVTDIGFNREIDNKSFDVDAK